MKAKLRYAIKLVANMDNALRFHRDTLGLSLRFQSPEWSEFATDGVTPALHPPLEKSPTGKVEPRFVIEDLKEVYENREKMGIEFTSEPKPLHGVILADIVDGDGARCSLREE